MLQKEAQEILTAGYLAGYMEKEAVGEDLLNMLGNQVVSAYQAGANLPQTIARIKKAAKKHVSLPTPFVRQFGKDVATKAGDVADAVTGSLADASKKSMAQIGDAGEQVADTITPAAKPEAGYAGAGAGAGLLAGSVIPMKDKKKDKQEK